MLFGLAQALACAIVTNVGFLLRHRGAVAAPAVDGRSSRRRRSVVARCFDCPSRPGSSPPARCWWPPRASIIGAGVMPAPTRTQVSAGDSSGLSRTHLPFPFLKRQHAGRQV